MFNNSVVTLNIESNEIRYLVVRGKHIHSWGSVPLPPGLIMAIDEQAYTLAETLLAAINTVLDADGDLTADPLAERYNVWYVLDKTDIPLCNSAGSPAPAMAVPDCSLVAAAPCPHTGGVPGVAGTKHYYNALGACADGSEAAE